LTIEIEDLSKSDSSFARKMIEFKQKLEYKQQLEKNDYKLDKFIERNNHIINKKRDHPNPMPIECNNFNN